MITGLFMNNKPGNSKELDQMFRARMGKMMFLIVSAGLVAGPTLVGIAQGFEAPALLSDGATDAALATAHNFDSAVAAFGGVALFRYAVDQFVSQVRQFELRVAGVVDVPIDVASRLRPVNARVNAPVLGVHLSKDTLTACDFSLVLATARLGAEAVGLGSAGTVSTRIRAKMSKGVEEAWMVFTPLLSHGGFQLSVPAWLADGAAPASGHTIGIVGVGTAVTYGDARPTSVGVTGATSHTLFLPGCTASARWATLRTVLS